MRLGRQVVSWGESTFIQGGLNSSNPFDVNALRRPGASLKEGLLPVGMLYVNAGVTENLSIEAFYQYDWEKTQIDGCGTYFSGADFAADGCNFVSVGPLGDQAGLAAGIAAKREADMKALWSCGRVNNPVAMTSLKDPCYVFNGRVTWSNRMVQS